MQNEITLFVMPGCNMCPHMEKIFHDLHRNGAIHELQVVDVSQHPELAEQHNIRSVPFYLINGVAFNGLKTRQQIDHLLQQDSTQKWVILIEEELSAGQLETVEESMQQDADAREAMLQLLADSETELVVRIGLTAIIESLAEGSILKPYEQQFIELSQHEDERIALDALYYLSLLSTTSSLEALTEIANNGKQNLREDARELLAETVANRVLH